MITTFHDRYMKALRSALFVPVNDIRHFGREGEVFVRYSDDFVFIWAYDDYGIRWRFFGDELQHSVPILPESLFKVHVSRTF